MQAGLPVGAVAHLSVPPKVVVLGEEAGLPEVEPLEVVLVRSAASRNRACDAFTDAILDEAAGGLPG